MEDVCCPKYRTSVPNLYTQANYFQAQFGDLGARYPESKVTPSVAPSIGWTLLQRHELLDAAATRAPEHWSVASGAGNFHNKKSKTP